MVGVFNERGYEAASMEDLAKASGFTKSIFYHHVSGKEELLRMAVDRALDALSAALDELFGNGQPRFGKSSPIASQAISRCLLA